ncbi:MAG: transposase [Deltaproteobacteria bacterium]|nr:transposase [Deltaproteobacteria bacterium]
MMKHGGRREGAGRPRKSWRSVREAGWRPVFRGWRPFHVTLRVHMEAVGRLRQRENYHAIRKAMHTAFARTDFRINQISLEVDHIHLLVEAADGDAFKRGIHGFMVAAARRLNVESGPVRGRRARLVRDASGKQRVIAASRRGRRGAVFIGRYHVVAITSPWQARNALRYVLNNYRHHDEAEFIPGHGPWVVDYYSSGPGFLGWAEYRQSSRPFPIFPAYQALPVQPARTWLLAEGWRRAGPISLHDVPGHPRW